MGRHFFVTGDDFILRPVLEAISRAGSIAAVYFGVSYLIWKIFLYLFFDHFLNLDYFYFVDLTQKVATSTVLEFREVSGTGLKSRFDKWGDVAERCPPTVFHIYDQNLDK